LTVTDDDALLDDDPPESEALLSGPVEPVRATTAVAWKVLVVDDDADVLLMSRLALRGLVLEGDGVALVCVASAAEARAYLTSPEADVAVVLLDVVMEDDTAGLDLAHWIRAQVTDRSLRIVLRTGQPGSAPESSVMNAYDIHDYLAKADTTARRLVTSVLGALRACRDIRTIHRQRAGLQGVLGAVGGLFLASPAPGVQIPAPCVVDDSGVCGPAQPVAPTATPGPRGDVEALALDVAAQVRALLAPQDVRVAMFAVAGTERVRMAGPACVDLPLTLPEPGSASTGTETWVYSLDVGAPPGMVIVVAGKDLQAWTLQLAELYGRAAALAFRNARLHDEQRAWIQTLGRFVPRELSALVGNGDLRSLTPGDNTTHAMTVCFVDVRSFSARTARVGGPTAFRLLNMLFARLADIVAANGGIIDKYLGDGMLVLFPNAPRCALLAAESMQRAVAALEVPDDAPLRIAIGLHWGDVVVGAVGHKERLDLSVVSAVVNMAARVQELSRHLACDILVTDDFVARLDLADRAYLRPVLVHDLRGDHRARALWEALGHLPTEAVALRLQARDLLAEATEAAQRGAWDVSASLLAVAALETRDDPTLHVLLERADAMRRATEAR
jgi:class 3 adenylate cyclase